MALKLVIDLEQSAADLLSGYGAGALISIERDTVEAMTGAAEVGTEAIVSGTQQYEWWDASGGASHYYRTRVRDSGDTKQSAYGAVFQGTAESTYATILDVTKGGDLPDESRFSYLSDLLAERTEAVDDTCHRQFFRDPQVTGDGTWTLDVSEAGLASLAFASDGLGFTDGGALDLISVTTLEYRTSEDGSYTTLTEGTDFLLSDVHKPGWPYEDVTLMATGAITSWPTGLRAVRIAGVRGFSSVPARVKVAVADSAREAYRQSVLGANEQQGVNVFGVPVLNTGRPTAWREVLDKRVSPYIKTALLVR